MYNIGGGGQGPSVGAHLVQYDPPRPYARASRVGNLVFLAGETGTDGHTGHLVSGGIAEQTEQAFRNLRESMDQFALGWDDLVRMDVFLTDSAHIRPFMEVLRTYLPEGSPPGALVCVKELAHAGMLVEIECIGAIPDAGAGRTT
jgi:2-iminobutanoate/2-iminopropanoate deaminase